MKLQGGKYGVALEVLPSRCQVLQRLTDHTGSLWVLFAAQLIPAYDLSVVLSTNLDLANPLRAVLLCSRLEKGARGEGSYAYGM